MKPGLSRSHRHREFKLLDRVQVAIRLCIRLAQGGLKVQVQHFRIRR
jgi:hypothetical protein